MHAHILHIEKMMRIRSNKYGLLVCSVVVLLAVSINGNSITCKSKKSPCFLKHLYCPAECPSTTPSTSASKVCYLDCNSPLCQPQCRSKPFCIYLCSFFIFFWLEYDVFWVGIIILRDKMIVISPYISYSYQFSFAHVWLN